MPATASGPVVPPPRRAILGCAALLVLAALAAYHNTFRVPFLFDDLPAVVDNPTIRHLGDLGSVLFPNAGHGITVGGRPVLNLSLALCYAVSGTNVWSYHAFNLLVHILAGLTLFGVVRRTLVRIGSKEQGARSREEGGQRAQIAGYMSMAGQLNGHGSSALDLRPRPLPPAPPSLLLGTNATAVAFAVALLWTLHPLQTEAVTYIIQRTESLMGLFVLLTLYCFIRAAEAASTLPLTAAGPGWNLPSRQVQAPAGTAGTTGSVAHQSLVWSALSVCSCLLGVGSKEVAAVAPVLVFFYDRTFVAGTFREAWLRRRWLHLALAATWVPLAILVASTGWNRGGTAGFNVGVSPWAYWGTQFEAVVRYLKLAVWPHPQAFEYGTFWIHSPFEVLWPGVVVFALLGVTLWALYKRPRSGFLGAWFFGILAPTSVVPGTIQMIVEHRMYLPLAAVIAAAVVGVERLGTARRERGPQDHGSIDPTPADPAGLVVRGLWSRGLRLSGPLVPLLALALGAGVLTEQRNRVYQSDLSIWEDTVAKRPESSLAQSGLGTALFLRGHEREALFHYEIALHLNRNTPTLHYNLGLALLKLNRRPEAEAQFAEACRLNPRYHSAYYELGLTRLQMGQPEAAAAQFAEAARLMPTMTEAHYEWGVALAQMGRWTEAVDQYQAALRLDPGLVAAECDLGTALYHLSRVPEAAACFQRALRRDPNLPEAHFNLGLALARTGSMESAIAQYAAAVRLKPAYAAAQFHLGLALAQAGRLAEAIDHLQKLVELEPASAEAHCNLGVALSKAGRPEDAVAEYEAALRLRPDYAAVHYNLGNALLALRRNAEARQQLAEALRLDPQLDAARQLLDRLRAAPDAP